MSILVADIGGTNARFAIAKPGASEIAPVVLMTAGFKTPEDAIAFFLAGQGVEATALDGAVLSGAGPLRDDGLLRLTNGSWELDPEHLRYRFGFQFVRILNDVAAAGRAVPSLGTRDLERIGGGPSVTNDPRVLIAPGTGLGLASIVNADGKVIVIAGEGGHASLAPGNDREIAIVFHLLRQFGHVSWEWVLSGPGFELLYTTLSALDGSGNPPLSPVDIMASAKRGDPQAVECVQIFTGWLGSVSGDAALLLGARGGVYLGGGVLPRWGNLFDRDLFRRRFEAKGQLDEYLKVIPTYLISRQDLGLLGCLKVAEELLR